MVAGAHSPHLTPDPALAATRFVLWPAAAAAMAVSFRMAEHHPFTTITGMGPAWRWSAAGAAATLVVVAATLSSGGRRGQVAAAVLAVMWWMPDGAGWSEWPVTARTGVSAATAFVPVVAVVLVTAVVGCRRVHRLIVIALAVGGAALRAGTRLFLVDPFVDAECWRDCETNPWAISAAAVAGMTDRAGSALLIVAAGGVVVVAATTPATWFTTTASVTAAAGVGLVGATVFGEVVRRTSWDDPGGPALRAAMVAATLATLALAAGVIAERIGQWRLRAALAHLVDALRDGPPRGSLASVMAAQVGDPDLRIAYWSPVRESWVDADGATTSLPEPGAERVTTIARRGQRIAAIAHHPGTAGSIEAVIGPAMRLWIENEQLRAATLAELAELQASRARLIERSDHERRQLERNLHDGVQQRVVGMALLLRMLRNRLDRGDDGATSAAARAQVRRAEELLDTLLADLRRIGRGIHPGLLATEGLRAAISALADSSELDVHIVGLPDDRYSPGVEAAVYLVVAEATHDARRRAATSATIQFEHVGDTLVVDVVDDAARGSGEHSVHDLDDRVLAVGGSMTVVGDGSKGTRVRVELPCR